MSNRHMLAAACQAVIAIEAVESRVLLSGAPPTLTPEQPLPGDITPALSVGDQTNPSLAEGPNGVSLAVWQDTRSGGNPNVPFGVGLGTMTDIYAARIRPDGSVIDVTPIPVSNASYNQVTPRAAWNGTNWLVAWDTPRENDPYETDIHAVRVSANGVVLDQQPVVIGAHIANPQASNDLDPIGPLEVVSDGTDWVVTYHRHNPNLAGGIGMEWFAVKVLANGTVPNVEGVKILTADQYADTFGLTFSHANGGQYLHTFGLSDGQVYARRYSTDLIAIGGVQNVTADMMDRVSVAGGPNGWLLSWAEDSGSWQRVLARRISSSGAFYDTTPLQVKDYMYGAWVSLDAAWNGIDWTIAYSGNGPETLDQDIIYRRIDPTAIGAAAFKSPLVNVVPTPSYQGDPQLSSSADGGVKMVYVDQATTKPGIAVAVVSPTDTLLARADVSLAAPSQAGSRLASDGTHLLMVFASSTAYGTRLLAQRVEPSGAAVDQEPFVIADTSVGLGNYEVVYINGRYVVLFNGTTGPNGNQIYARTFTPNGTLGSITPLVANQTGIGFSLSDAAVNGDRLILVGNSSEGNAHRSSRYFKIFDSALQPLSARTDLDFGFALGGDTEAVNGGWIAAWAYKTTHDAPRAGIAYALITLDGQIPARGSPAGTYPNNGTPTVVSNGAEAASEAMIIYNQSRDAINPQIVNSDGLRAQRVTAAGTMIGGQITLIDEPGIQTQPAAVFDGTDYVLTWTDQRNYAWPAQSRDDIFAARVAVDGTVVDPGGFAVADALRPETHGDVGVAAGRIMFAYNSFRDESPWGSYRLVTRGTLTADTTPPTLLSEPRFDREYDQAVHFQFNNPLMGVDLADLIVENLTTGQSLPANAFTIDVIPAANEPWTYRWKFAAGIMPDGNYRATLPAGSVADFAGNATTTDIVVNFRVLAGDADGNGVINFDDYARIDAGFNQGLSGFSNGDFDYNGVVNFDDYALIDLAFGNQRTNQRPSPVELPPAKKPGSGKLGGGKLTI